MKQRNDARITWDYSGCGNSTAILWSADRYYAVKKIDIVRRGSSGVVFVFINDTTGWEDPLVGKHASARLEPLVKAGIFSRYVKGSDGLGLEFDLRNGTPFCESAVKNGLILMAALGMGCLAYKTPEVTFIPMIQPEPDGPWSLLAEVLRDKYYTEYLEGAPPHPELFPHRDGKKK
jgi:hypothetical protein